MVERIRRVYMVFIMRKKTGETVLVGGGYSRKPQGAAYQHQESEQEEPNHGPPSILASPYNIRRSGKIMLDAPIL